MKHIKNIFIRTEAKITGKNRKRKRKINKNKNEIMKYTYTL